MLVIWGILAGCMPDRTGVPPSLVPSAADDPIAGMLDGLHPAALGSMGYSIQVGAFASLENAVRLEATLTAQGVDAYYFRDESGLYKVRFGNHDHYDTARREAERLHNLTIIQDFFIVIPEDYAHSRIQRSGQGDLGTELVKTARRFIGVPYRWGGEDRNNGFDCSGLTMVCYRLNGLNLPRNSRSQYQAGTSVQQHALAQGDLVFFATQGGTRVTHVGLYIGNGKFIHAPRTGKTVRIENLSNRFFARTYVGGRRYF